MIQSKVCKTDTQINGKYIPQLLIFLINILETSQNRGLVLPTELVPTDWQIWYQHLQPKRLNVNQPEQFYFMFYHKVKQLKMWL